MFQQLRTATLMLLTLTILTGGVYPLVVTAVAQLMFPDQANGSIVLNKEQKIGSSLIGQSFTSPMYFWSRLSATSITPYNAAASNGSNYGPMNPALTETAIARITALKSAAAFEAKVPVDLVTSSASGLDPHISPAAAELQVERVAAATDFCSTPAIEVDFLQSFSHIGVINVALGDTSPLVFRSVVTLDVQLEDSLAQLTNPVAHAAILPVVADVELHPHPR